MLRTEYTLHRSRKIFDTAYGWYKKKGNTLSDEDFLNFERDLEALDKAIIEGNQSEASRLAHKVEVFTKAHFKKSVGQYVIEIVLALALALAIATVVRQTWFELYEIPTGSMRPTFREQDHLTVSKTEFGINIPLRTAHFYFDPDLVERTGVVIWSGDGVALRDVDTTYFGIFPYKKRFIKRLMGKPGDILYFYGGKIYGIDKKGKVIEEMVKSPYLEKLEYIPFLNFEGEMTSPSRGVVQFEQMHQPIGQLRLEKSGNIVGEIYNNKEWVKDDPASLKAPHKELKTYSDFWGIGNYAMARLLTPEELKQFPDLDTKDLEKGVLYLELVHHPSLTYPRPLMPRGVLNTHVLLNPLHSVIPVQEKHLNALMDNMYTARFEVKDGLVRRYSVGDSQYSYTSPRFPGIPNGTYEFYYGKGEKVGFGGRTTDLPSDHPLYKKTPFNVQNLYNFGIEPNTFFEPVEDNTYLFPHRYAYFRDGDLYLLGAPIYKKEDPLLQSFLERELKKEKQSTDKKPYIAFKDQGPPDIETIKNFGLELPIKNYLVLGDNHAMSADSRVFGFLPEDNLQGVPSFILWPTGHRWGFFDKPPYATFTLPRIIIWFIVALFGLGWYLWHRRKLKKPSFHKM